MPMVPGNSLFMQLREVRKQTRKFIVESDTNLVVLIRLAAVVSIATVSEITEMAGLIKCHTEQAIRCWPKIMQAKRHSCCHE